MPVSSGRISPQLAAQVAQIEAREEHLNQSTWAKEMLAEDCGRVFESFWDSLNAATNQLEMAASFRLGEITLGQWNIPESLPHGIQIWNPTGGTTTLSSDEWRQFVQQSIRDGWRLVETEFRQTRFDLDSSGRPAESRFSFSSHLTKAFQPQRAILEGELSVAWSGGTDGAAPVVKSIDASRLTIKSREGDPPFQLVLTERLTPIRNSRSIDPLIIYDLDGDGWPEIILAALNKVYHRRADGGYRRDSLCRQSPGVIYAALVADFDGDGAPDFLCETYEGLVLYQGSPRGTFDRPGRLVWASTRDVRYPMALTCGDVDHDGDLDLFLAQYKLPYDGGQMPTPYYNANDGFPAFLLLNDGHGNFTDATARAGLSPKAHRRSYGACFVDLDSDGQLDLLVASDFAGVDLYRNDGRGRFTDVTRQWLTESHLFGMALTMADFNADGRLDFFVSGMPSPTADRLDHLGLWRPDSNEDRSMRARMTHGNRLYLAKPGRGFDEVSTQAKIDRSGWSWGCAAADFDNDGYPDVYVVNGMETRQSVREYEGEFWLHDAHVGSSADDPAVATYLQAKVTRLRGTDGSYGGYEHNRLFLNRNGTRFEELAYLFGVALAPDCRNVIPADLDGDGRVDLVVTGYEPWPDQNQRLWIYRNALPDAGNWIGLRFQDERGASPIGVKATLRADHIQAVQELVTGDCYRSQHPNTLHFGLGKATQVQEIEIQWADGQTVTLHRPALNRYHVLHPAPK